MLYNKNKVCARLTGQSAELAEEKTSHKNYIFHSFKCCAIEFDSICFRFISIIALVLCAHIAIFHRQQ